MLTDPDRQVVQAFKRLLHDAHVPLYQVVAFGSRARGDADPDSDLDVLVVVDHVDREMRTRISDCAWEAGFDAGIIVQSVVMTRAEIEDGPERSSLLMLAVRNEGIPV